jgi:nucleoside-diphosphate-sugar epimerase
MDFEGITLVTGAAGFIGRHLVRQLAELGVTVRASDRPGVDLAPLRQPGVDFVPADLTASETLAGLFAGDVDRVFHVGAICNLSTPYARLRPVNVEGVEHITRLALEAGVRCYVQVSSTSVYGRYRGKPFAEEDPREPQDDYGRSKRDGEDVVWKRIGEGLRGMVTRPCTVYGPGCNDGAGKVFSRPTATLAVPGSGDQLLSNVRVEDVACALVHLSHRDEALGRAFNIADDSHPTLEDALVLAARSFGGRAPRLHLPLGVVQALARLQGRFAALTGRIPDLEYDATRLLHDDYVVDNARLKQAGYGLIYPDFEASMRQLEAWYASEREASRR